MTAARLDSRDPSGETRGMSSRIRPGRLTFLAVACAVALATTATATSAPKKRALIAPTRTTTKPAHSVDQFVANKLVASGINRPIGSLLLGANTSDSGGISQFYGGANGGNLPTIGSPLSAFNTVFGGALPSGTSASALLARRKSILDTIKNEATTLKTSGSPAGRKREPASENPRI
jgi:hypothetical protein